VSPGRFAPLEASESAPPLAPRAGRRAPDGPPDGTAFPCRALLPRTPHAPRRHRGSLGSLAGTLFPYKMVAALLVPAVPRTEPSPAPLLAAAVELRARLAAHPSKLSPTFFGTHSSPQTFPKSPAQPHLAGTPTAAAAAGPLRRPSCQRPPHPHLWPKTGPLGPQHPSPALLRPSPAAARRNLAGPPLPGRPGTTLQEPRSFQGLSCKSASPIVKVSCCFL
jgi:hypothetical protein